MAQNPVETRFQLKRDRLLRAAAECFNKKGYSGTSLKDVADILNLTDAALYYYVRNKEELVYLCYVRAADVGREAMERAIAECDTGRSTGTTRSTNPTFSAAAPRARFAPGTGS